MVKSIRPKVLWLTKKLIGELKVPLTLLETKVLVVHVGLFQLLLLLKVFHLLKTDNFSNFLNKSLLIVLVENMKIKDVMVVGWIMLSNMLSIMVFLC